jgi:hypothetical protein
MVLGTLPKKKMTNKIFFHLTNTIQAMKESNDDKKYNEPSVIEIMKKFSPSFIKTLDTYDYEPIIKSFLFGYPFQFGFKIDDTPYHITYGYKQVINVDKVNNSPYIFFYSFTQARNNNLEIKITNRIKIEWLTSILPLYYNTNNFKTLYLNYDDNNKLILKELNSSKYESIITKIINSLSKNKILFDNVDLEYPILYNYIKLIKKS